MAEKNIKNYYRHKYYKKNDAIIKENQKKKKMLNSIKELVHNHKYSKALSEIEKYLSIYPTDSYGLFQKATILMLFDRLDEAEEIYNLIIDMELESKYSSLYKLGLLYALREDKQKAEEYYRKNIETSPYPEIYSRIELSTLEAMKGNFDNAYTILDGFYDRKVNDLDIKNVFDRFLDIPLDEINRVNLEKAKTKYVTQQTNEAKEIMSRIILDINDSFDREYYLLMGKIAQKEKDYELSLECLKKAQKGPKTDVYWKARLEIANDKNRRGEPEDAILICDTIINESSDNKKIAMRVKGDSLQILGRYEEARQMYIDASVKSGKDEIDALFSIGKMEYNNKNYESALECFKRASNCNILIENSCQFYKMLTLLKMKRYSEAYNVSKKVNKKILYEVKRREYKYAKLFLKKKLNIPYLDGNSYVYNQVTNYDFENALQHIKRIHIKDGLENEFNENIDVEELILELPLLLKKEDTEMVQNFFFEIYEIPYDDLGIENGEKTDTLRVVLLPNSYNVLTMLPCKKNTKTKRKGYDERAKTNQKLIG